MVTLKEMLNAHGHLKDQQTVWNAVVDFLGKYCRDGDGKALYGDNGEVPHEVMESIRQRILDEELGPISKKILELEGSTVEVKDGKEKGSKQVGRKARRRPRREAAGGDQP